MFAERQGCLSSGLTHLQQKAVAEEVLQNHADFDSARKNRSTVVQPADAARDSPTNWCSRGDKLLEIWAHAPSTETLAEKLLRVLDSARENHAQHRLAH